MSSGVIQSILVASEYTGTQSRSEQRPPLRRLNSYAEKPIPKPGRDILEEDSVLAVSYPPLCCAEGGVTPSTA